QAAAPTQTEPAAVESASTTVRIAMSGKAERAKKKDSETVSTETQTPASTPTADLASIVSYLKTLETELKTQSEALNGETPPTKTYYYKFDADRTLYWEGFMP
ncbi:hypothetical protein ACJONO_04705, partial [Mycoplasmopsis synoviae]